MTQLDRLKIRIPEEPDDGVLEDVLESAKDIILSRRFPFSEWPTRKVIDVYGLESDETYVEPRYLDLQIRIAIDLYNKAGAEGEISHTENGVARHYESSWVSQELLNEIIPYAAVVR